MIILIEIGDFFLYRWPSKKKVICYKSDYDASSNDRELFYSTKYQRPIEDEPTIVIIVTIPFIKNKRPPTAVLNKGNKVSNVMPSISYLKDGQLIFCVGIWCSCREGQFQVKVA